MEWISQNWVWVLFAAGMIAMHLFGHGGHGGNQSNPDTTRKDKARRNTEGSGHQH